LAVGLAAVAAQPERNGKDEKEAVGTASSLLLLMLGSVDGANMDIKGDDDAALAASDVAAIRTGCVCCRTVLIGCLPATDCEHVRACLWHFTTFGVTSSTFDGKFDKWSKLIHNHSSGADPMFPADRAEQLRKILDNCISFNVHPVVAGWLLFSFARHFMLQTVTNNRPVGVSSATAFTSTPSSSGAWSHSTSELRHFAAAAPNSRKVRCLPLR
jgi:hypothetical protein